MGSSLGGAGLSELENPENEELFISLLAVLLTGANVLAQQKTVTSQRLITRR